MTANSSFFTFGGDDPEDLLDAPFESYAASLAGKRRLIDRWRHDKNRGDRSRLSTSCYTSAIFLLHTSKSILDVMRWLSGKRGEK